MSLEECFVFEKSCGQRHKNGRPFAVWTKEAVFTSDESHPPMNKAQLTDEVQKRMGGDTSKRAAGQALDAVLDAIAHGVRTEERVLIVGFGTFKLGHREARMGRNPKKPDVPVEIPASKTVRFTAAETLKKSL
jgi:DNA-binding protein HU-beta